MTRQIAIRFGFSIKSGKVVKTTNKRQSVSDRIRQQKSKKVRVKRRGTP